MDRYTVEKFLAEEFGRVQFAPLRVEGGKRFLTKADTVRLAEIVVSRLFGSRCRGGIDEHEHNVYCGCPDWKGEAGFIDNRFSGPQPE